MEKEENLSPKIEKENLDKNSEQVEDKTEDSQKKKKISPEDKVEDLEEKLIICVFLFQFMNEGHFFL